jgi:arylsulfatase
VQLFPESKLWALTAAHLKSLMDFPPSQAADPLSLKTALEKAQDMMERPNRAGN